MKPSGYRDTFIINQAVLLTVKPVWISGNSETVQDHLVTMTVFGSSLGCHSKQLLLYLLPVASPAFPQEVASSPSSSPLAPCSAAPGNLLDPRSSSSPRRQPANGI